MENAFQLNGKTVLVTGASSGIGKQSAIAVSAAGGKLVITGRDEHKLGETLSELVGEDHSMIAGDLTSGEFIDKLIASCGQLDGLVHCAGYMQSCPVRFIAPEDIERTWAINYHAPVLLTAGLLKKKKISGAASVVFVTSVSGTSRPYYGGALYAGSKSALESFSRVLALEQASRKIRSNCISPAMVKTPLFDEYMGGLGGPEEISNYEKKYPLGFGEPSDIANAVVYLLSDASRWITGTTLLMDGGLGLTP